MAKKVLVVEDDSNIAELLRLYLEKDGFDVFLAADGGEGIRRAQELQPEHGRQRQNLSLNRNRNRNCRGVQEMKGFIHIIRNLTLFRNCLTRREKD